MTRQHFPDEEIWTNDNPTNLADPQANLARYQQGYENGVGKEPPDATIHNFEFNRSDQQHRHIEQNGIPRWDTRTTYTDGALALGSDDVIYQSQTANNQNNDPTTDNGTNWVDYLGEIRKNLTLSAKGWKLGNAIYEGVSSDLSATLSQVRFIHFGDSGSVAYAGTSSDQSIYQFDVTDAWKVGTLSFSQSVDLSSTIGTADITDVYAKPDGAKLYVLTSDETAYQFSFGTAWDVSTLSYDSVSFSVGGQTASSDAIEFSADGTVFWILGSDNDSVYEYTLTAWDMSTASYNSASLSVGTETLLPTDIVVGDGDTKLYVLGGISAGESVYEYAMSAKDLSTASYSGTSFNVSGQEGDPWALDFHDSGYRMYVAGDSAIVYEFYPNVAVNTNIT